ncbi:MAG TPA: RNA polymerase sigma factor [Bryobacteraceae bacterium]|nr:RNA polymerase sigma factor [Bryobacteraceae bacterium]
MTERDFRRAFDDHKDAVYAFALRLTGSAEVAEDVAQDCFVQLMRDPAKFDPARGSLRAFLLGVTRNLVFRYWREEARMDPLDEEREWPAPDSGNRSAAMLGVAGLVASAVQSLAPLQREAVVLFEYEGFTLEEIAKLVGADVGTVKSRLHRARERLRRALAPVRNGAFH